MANEKILVVDDDTNICELLRLYLTKEGYQVTTANDGEEGLDKFNQVKPDMVLLDVMMPKMDGLEVCRRIRKLGNTPVMMLTAKGETFDKVLGLELGADDYLTKPFSPRELAARVKALLRRAGHGNGNGNGHPASAPATSAAAPFHDDETGQRISLRGQALPLTRREYRLLSHLLRGAGRIHSRDALLAAAWGDDSESTDRTVDTHIKTLRAKLRELDPAREYISTHRGMGYCLDI